MASFGERIIGAIKLDPATYEEVEADQSAMTQALAVVVLSAIASGIGATGIGGGALISVAFVSLVGWLIWALVTWIVGTKVMPEPSTRADLGQLLRTIGFSSAPGLFNVLGIIPILGGIVRMLTTVWSIVAMVVAVRQALDYSTTGRAVLVCLIGFAGYMATIAIAAIVFGTAMAGLTYGMGS